MRLNRFAMTLGAVIAVVAVSACGDDDDPIRPDPNKQVEVFTAIMSGANETTPNSSTAGGSGTLRIFSTRADANSAFIADSMRYDLSWTGLSGNATGAHIHAPAPQGQNASVVHNFSAPACRDNCSVSGVFTTPSNTVPPGLTLQALAEAVRNGQAYFNVHAPTPYTGGEIRGQLVLAD